MPSKKMKRKRGERYDTYRELKARADARGDFLYKTKEEVEKETHERDEKLDLY